MLAADRAVLYAALAEALFDPPDWMSSAGIEWPLYELAASLLPDSPALLELSALPAEPRSARRIHYEMLFGNGRPRFWLHESGYLHGRILSPGTFAVARFYRDAGLEVNGSELPDHASLELAFLASLADRGDLLLERRFLEEHALRWLPDLGRSLSLCADSLYAALGQLLADFFERVAASSASQALENSVASTPILAILESCTLCGFCAQRCPTAALFVHETEAMTSLKLNAEKCNGCGKCIRICPDGLLALSSTTKVNKEKMHSLVDSERMLCSTCGAPTVSRAEFDYMVKKIGHPAWLELCFACRVSTPLGGIR